MKSFMKKFLLILLAIAVFYLLFPKYQAVNLDGRGYRMNKITGQIVWINPRDYLTK